MSQLLSSKSSSEKLGMSKHNAYEWVMTAALSVREDGHPIVVKQARVAGEQGLLIFIPGYTMAEGALQAIPAEPA